MRDYLLIALFVLLAAVLGAMILMWGRAPQAAAPSAGTPVSYTVLAEGAHSTVTTRKNYLITSDFELRGLWGFLRGAGAVPTVDFSKDDVAAVFAGTEPSAGYAISIASVQDADTRMVTVDIAAPGVSCLPAQTATEPFEVVLLPKTTLNLVHEDVAITTSCLN